MVTIIHKRPHEMNAIIFGTRKKAAPLRAAQNCRQIQNGFCLEFFCLKNVSVVFRNPLPFRQASSNQAPVVSR
ncbi:hypothetical protein J2Y73_004880 [Peribacillus frigoritolerans]|nr:hypothetical protein [Peribacillus frigoritolerans]